MPILEPSTSKLATQQCFPTIAVSIDLPWPHFTLPIPTTKYYLIILTWLGHYIEHTSETEDLVWIEIYKSDRVQDIPLTQWLALTPADIVANTLKIDLSIAQNLKKEKQLLIAGNQQNQTARRFS